MALFNVPITAIDELAEFAGNEAVASTVVGPEAPLADGIVDTFRAAGAEDLRADPPLRSARKLERLRQELHGRARHSHCDAIGRSPMPLRRTPTSIGRARPS